MANAQYPALLLRAKKMAGAMGVVPSEGDLVQRFVNNGTKITVATARSLVKDLADWWRDRKTKSKATKAAKSSPKPKPEKPKKPAPQPEPEGKEDEDDEEDQNPVSSTTAAPQSAPVEQKPTTPAPGVEPAVSSVPPRYGGATRSTSYGRH